MVPSGIWRVGSVTNPHILSAISALNLPDYFINLFVIILPDVRIRPRAWGHHGKTSWFFWNDFYCLKVSIIIFKHFKFCWNTDLFWVTKVFKTLLLTGVRRWSIESLSFLDAAQSHGMLMPMLTLSIVPQESLQAKRCYAFWFPFIKLHFFLTNFQWKLRNW